VDEFKDWVQVVANVRFAIRVPTDYSKLALNVALLAGILLLVKLAFTRFHAFFTSSVPWVATACCITVSAHA
jgi:hypothetical protein